MSGLNPQGVTVCSFKQLCAEDLNRDFLWRYQKSLLERGSIGIYSRSHYEEVLVVMVHPSLLAKERLMRTWTTDTFTERSEPLKDFVSTSPVRLRRVTSR